MPGSTPTSSSPPEEQRVAEVRKGRKIAITLTNPTPKAGGGDSKEATGGGGDDDATGTKDS